MKNLIAALLLISFGFAKVQAQQNMVPEHLNNIVYASPYTNFHGGKGFGLAFEHYLIPNKRLSLFAPISFGFRDYFVTSSNNPYRALGQQAQVNLPESRNYSVMLHPGIKFYCGKNTSFLSYVVGTSLFLSYGTDNGYKRFFDHNTHAVLYRYSAGNELRVGAKFDQYLNFRISERLVMEFQGSFGLVSYSRFIAPGNSKPGIVNMMGLIGVSFGYRF